MNQIMPSRAAEKVKKDGNSLTNVISIEMQSQNKTYLKILRLKSTIKKKIKETP
jgi:hypothetical protein